MINKNKEKELCKKYIMVLIDPDATTLNEKYAFY